MHPRHTLAQPFVYATLTALAAFLAACGEDSAPSDTNPDTIENDTVESDTPENDTVESDTSENDTLESDTTDTETHETDTAAPATFRFERLTVSGGTPVWGAIATHGYLIGGVTNAQNVVSTIATATLSEGTLTLTETGATDLPRYCHCAFFDPTRDELVVLGGRGRTFADAASSAVIDTSSWRSTPLADHTADDFPVGCVAFFSPLSDKGYVYGGLSTSRREFSPTTHRYDPTSRTFEPLTGAGPEARYDAAVHVLSDGDALLFSGMGLDTTVTFYDDVWRFDAETETWSEVPTTGTRPPGRRYAWTALSPDETLLVFGYGSDSPTGNSVLDDLWSLDLTTNTWAPLPLDGERPSARGFAPNWQLPAEALDRPDAVGLLGFGSDATLRVTSDVYLLVPPPRHAGLWR